MNEAVVAIVTTVFATIVLAWIENSALREPEVAEGRIVLRYSRGIRLLLVVGAAFCIACCAAMAWPLVAGGSGKELLQLGIVSAFFLPLAFFAWGEARVCLEADEQGTRGRAAFGGTRAMSWSDVTSVAWSPLGDRFVLRDRHGVALRVSAKLQGVRAWIALLERNVPEPLWHRATKSFAPRGWQR